MSLIVTFNGANYIIPTTNEVGWGSNLDAFFVAIAAGSLQKTGGLFTLSAPLDFGPGYGVNSLYYTSRTANPASTGILRLANNSDSISFRNAANNADLPLSVNASNQLTFNGTPIESNALTSAHILVGNASNVATDVPMSGDVAIDNTGSTTIQANAVTGSKIASNTITNSNINSAAAIAYSKLALTGSVTNADLAGSIAYSKLVLTNSIVNADIATAAAIAYSKLALSNSIVNADINSAAAIAYSKLTLTNSIVNADINTAAAIAYSKLSLTGSVTNSDLAGSIAYSKLVLTNSIVNGDINSAAAIAYSKLNLATSVVNGDISTSAAIAYSKLNLSASIVNADIATAAAIVRSKLTSTETTDVTYASGKGIFFTDSGTNTVKITAPTTITSTYALKWPVAQGASNQYLTNDGSGNMSWTNAAGTGTVNSGTAGQLAYYATSTNAVSAMSALAMNGNQLEISGAVTSVFAGNLALYDTTAMAAGVGGQMEFGGNYLTGGGITQFASIQAQKANATSANLDTNLFIRNRSNVGGMVTAIEINPSQQVLHTNGTVAAPSVSFISEPGLGMYRGGAGDIVFAAGGVTLLEMVSAKALFSGVLLPADGTVGAPAFSFGSDQTTGMYRIGASSIGFALGGTLRVTMGPALTVALALVPDATASLRDIGSSTQLWQNIYATGIVGTTTNNSAAAGNVGEYVSSSQTSATNFPTSGNWGDAVSISLTAGDWDVAFTMVADATSSTWSNAAIGISSTSGNSSTGLNRGDNYIINGWASSSSTPTASAAVIPAYRVSISSTTTYYGKVSAFYSAGTPQYHCRLSARRVR